MAYQVTATRKRPQFFETVVGQQFVVSTLTNSIKQGRIAHAYLFSGPRGVGKTTCARLLAKALNCEEGTTAEPCGKCDSCVSITQGNSPDVFEIDGASNTSVNDIRVIKDEIFFRPKASKYKIYIIDEVHMLSISAFNALLKTIEEPPEYVIFIFATTELQKVPATIRSRCQQFNFQLLNLETIKSMLAQAAEEMGIKAEDKALFWIAKEATGSMRDAYTLFDQIVAFSDNDITMEKIQEKLGILGPQALADLLIKSLEGDTKAAMTSLEELFARGCSTEQLIKDFAQYFRTLLLLKKGIDNEAILAARVEDFPKILLDSYSEQQLEKAFSTFLDLFRDVRYSINPRFDLELAVSRLSMLKYDVTVPAVLEQLARFKNDILNKRISPLDETFAKEKDIDPKPPKEKEPQPAAEPADEPELEQEEAFDCPEAPETETESQADEEDSASQQDEAEEETVENPADSELEREDDQDILLVLKDYAKKNDFTKTLFLQLIQKIEKKDGKLLLYFKNHKGFSDILEKKDDMAAFISKALGSDLPLELIEPQSTGGEKLKIVENDILDLFNGRTI